MKAKTPIETMLDNLDYRPVKEASPSKGGLPHVTHEGILQIDEISIKVYVLSTGKRIIPESELQKIFGLTDKQK